jgi:hypothetical protein
VLLRTTRTAPSLLARHKPRAQVVWELVGGAAVIGALSAGCASHPEMCGPISGVLNFAVRSCIH